MTRSQRILLTAGTVLASGLLCQGLLAALPAADDSAAFRIYTGTPGVHRLDYSALVAAGLVPRQIASAGLAMTNQGTPVPIWIEDGDDGVFSSDDYLEFVAEQLSGDGVFYHEHSRANVYRLQLDAEGGARMIRRSGSPLAADTPQALRRSLHLERDELLIRLSAQDIERTDNAETWYWSKLTHIDRQPFLVDLDLADVESTGSVSLRVAFRGLSKPSRPVEGFPDHVVEISVDGEPIGQAEWTGRDVHRATFDIDASRLAGGRHRLEIRVPKRISEDADDPLIDAMVLNWIELDFPSNGSWDGGMRRFEPVEPAAGRTVELIVTAGEVPVVYAEGGDRIEPAASTTDSGTRLRFTSADDSDWYLAADSTNLLAPVRIEFDRPSDLAGAQHAADYLMIVHSQLREAIEPLADFHRQQGLDVLVVDIQDIYDEFNHGILDPRAVHDFIDHAYHQWKQPAPRFVLLVGDASWDSKHDKVDDANYANWTANQLFVGDRFVARKTPMVADSSNLRNLVPTWSFHSSHGHSASDNYFVSVDGDDHLPDLAIGRFPVTEPEEVEAIVAKTIRYATAPPAGPWRRDILWITNEEESFQRRSDGLAEALEERGFGAMKVYPQAAERSNEHHQEDLQEAFNRGASLVHFYGHGGRHIWRTGPPDFKKNHDLFALKHIDALAPNERLPIVLSMTCFSAPFDHPNADSIGEKFLRVAGRGAVAVLGASWRNAPSMKFSEALLDQLLTPGTPIGTAIQHAKSTLTNRTLIETYNLLGDPALALAIPAWEVGITRLTAPGISVEATLEVPGFSGRAVVDWLDAQGALIASDTVVVTAPTFRAHYAGHGTPERVRIYAWNEESGIDAAGALSLGDGEEAATLEVASGAAD